MENFDCCKFGKTEPEEHSSDAVRHVINNLLDELDAINNLNKKNRKFPSGGVVNESAQGEFVVSDRTIGKKYTVKPEFIKAASKILGFAPMVAPPLVWRPSRVEKILREYGVFDLFCEEAKEEKEWGEPEIDLKINGLTCSNKYRKAHLMIRMQSWADFHNRLDGFVADWRDESQDKYGMTIFENRIVFTRATTENCLIFQICVGSMSRRQEMHDYFKAQIEELIQLKMI